MYHFIGIKGTGMSSLALIMHSLGYKVQGSDKDEHYFTEANLIAAGIDMFVFNEKNITKDLIIVQGNAFTESNVEVKKAKELNLKIYTYQEMIGLITKNQDTIAVSGCHGKTTTTSMLAHVLNNVVGCNYLIGDGSGYASLNNKYFALEACEFKRHFLEYEPSYVIITNIELDHIDYFKDIDDVILAYQQFSNKASKMVIACGDDQHTRKLKTDKKIIYYGIESDNDIQAVNIVYSDIGTEFDVLINNDLYGHFNLPLYGKHMLLNALSVIGICYFENIESSLVSKYLNTYTGAKRRFKETIIDDIVTIDDYAHHPTEVEVTIKAARQKYPDKKIVAILKTHTLSRTKEFALEFANAMNLADDKYIMDIGVDREEIGYDDVNYSVVLDKIKDGKYIDLDSYDELLKYKNAVLIFMSSKDIYILKDLYEKQLLEKR